MSSRIGFSHPSVSHGSMRITTDMGVANQQTRHPKPVPKMSLIVVQGKPPHKSSLQKWKQP